MQKKIETFYIRTYGCQMNELDSEIMTGILTRRGYTQVTDEKKADLIIFNTCSVRDLAERKVLGKIGQLNRKKRAIIGVTGCMATSKKKELFSKADGIDFIIGTNNIHELDQVLDEVLQNQEEVIRADDRFSHELDYLDAVRNDKLKAYVSIIRGCNKHCTYCIVPHTRGPEVSRDPKSIIEECQQLANNGYKEITLLGQNVNSYGKDNPSFATRFPDLLCRIDAIKGIERVRFLTSHPVDISKELMEAIRDLKTVCEFVHFPLQAGSNRILKKMHRSYTKEEYIEKVSLLRSLVPNVTIGTDIIVGFPTETEEEFQETLSLFKEMRFTTGFLFSYSRRKGAPAARWEDDVPEEEKAKRLKALLDAHTSIVKEELSKLRGATVEVLVEGVPPKDEGFLRGRTRTFHNVIFPGAPSLIGTVQHITVDRVTAQTLVGKICDKKTSFTVI